MKEYSPRNKPFYGFLTSVVVRITASLVLSIFTHYVSNQDAHATAKTLASSKSASVPHGGFQL